MEDLEDSVFTHEEEEAAENSGEEDDQLDETGLENIFREKERTREKTQQNSFSNQINGIANLKFQKQFMSFCISPNTDKESN